MTHHDRTLCSKMRRIDRLGRAEEHLADHAHVRRETPFAVLTRMGGAKSGGYFASGASSVGYGRFDRDIASLSSAIREINGKKKHLRPRARSPARWYLRTERRAPVLRDLHRPVRLAHDLRPRSLNSFLPAVPFWLRCSCCCC